MRPRKNRGYSKYINSLRKESRTWKNESCPGQGIYYSYYYSEYMHFGNAGDAQPMVPRQHVTRFERWCRRTGNKVWWQWDWTGCSSPDKFDRGMFLGKSDGVFKPSIYESFKKALGFPTWLRVGDEDLRNLYDYTNRTCSGDMEMFI